MPADTWLVYPRATQKCVEKARWGAILYQRSSPLGNTFLKFFYEGFSMNISSFPPDSFLRLSQVLSLIPIKRSRWYKGVRSGEFPTPFPISPDGRAKFYRAADIYDLMEKIAASGTGGTTKEIQS